MLNSLLGRNPVQVCDDLQSSYWNASYSYKPTSWSTTTTTIYYNYTTYYTTSTWSCTSTCAESAPYGSNICYADSKTILTTGSSVADGVVTSTLSTGNEYPGPSPTCSVALSDCTNLWSSFSSADKEWSRIQSVTPPPAQITASPTKPFCNTCKANRCTIDRAQADLYFWPVPANATTRNMCASMPTSTWASRPPEFPNSTWTEVTTGPYAVVNGNTFYSGNVYVSISSIEAHFPCQSTLTRYNSILTLASTDIFTKRGYPINDIPWSVNYADFNEPVPYSAWYGEPECNLRLPPCSVVFPGEYRPQMAMPAAIRGFDPAWADCSLGYFGLDDPPIALKSAGNFLSSSSVPALPVTTPNDPPSPSSTQATPADPPAPPTSQPTARPPTPSNDPPSDPPSDPNDPTDPGSSPGIPTPSRPGNAPSNPPNNPPNPPNSPGFSLSNGQPGATRPGNGNPGPITITDAPGGPIVADPTGGVIINPGTTLQPGDPPIVISGTTISAAPTGVVIADPTGTRTIPFQSNAPGGVTITAGGSTLVADPSGIVVAPGTTIQPGDPPLVISGTTFSVAPTGVVVIGPSGTQTIPFQTGAGQAIITVGGSTLVAGPSGIVVAPGTTLHPGDAPITVDGTTISVGPSGVVVVGPDGVTSTVALPTGASGSSVLTLTLGNGDVVTAKSSNGQVVIGDVTLTLGGPAATLPGGQVVSLGPSGVVVGTGTAVSTAVFADPTVTNGGSPGGSGVPGAASRAKGWTSGAVGVVIAAALAIM